MSLSSRGRLWLAFFAGFFAALSAMSWDQDRWGSLEGYIEHCRRDWDLWSQVPTWVWIAKGVFWCALFGHLLWRDRKAREECPCDVAVAFRREMVKAMAARKKNVL